MEAQIVSFEKFKILSQRGGRTGLRIYGIIGSMKTSYVS